MTSEPVPEGKSEGTIPAKVGESAAPCPAQAAVPAERPPMRPAPATGAAMPVPASLAPAPAAAPNPLGHLSTPFQAVDYGLKGFHLEATVDPGQVVAAAAELDREGFSLDTITGVDWMAAGQMELVYDYFHPTRPLRVVVRARVPRDQAEIPSISQVFPGANWHERETHDFFGIRFSGHPDLSPFLLPEDATYHPLRKDFISC
jgi:NADH-quinone oxidoreductase subunit C